MALARDSVSGSVGLSRLVSPKGYLRAEFPSKVGDSSAAVPNTDPESRYHRQVQFTGFIGEGNGNYAEYTFVVPEDIDTSVEIQLSRWIYFTGISGTTDPDTQRYGISWKVVGDGETTTGVFGTPINLLHLGSSVANEKNSFTDESLTGLAASVSPGDLLLIRIARHGDNLAEDESEEDSYSGPLVLEYTKAL